MKEITLESTRAIVIVTQEQLTVTTDTVQLLSVTDNGSSVVAVISVAGNNKQYVLWDGQDYTAIGNWTDALVESRIKEIF